MSNSDRIEHRRLKNVVWSQRSSGDAVDQMVDHFGTESSIRYIYRPCQNCWKP